MAIIAVRKSPLSFNHLFNRPPREHPTQSPLRGTTRLTRSTIYVLPHFVSITLLSIFLSTGCAPRETQVEIGNRTGVVHIASTGEPSELDPHIINAPPDFRIIDSLFEGLLKGNSATLEPEPGVAESWKLSEDRLTYTFHLRANARWSNGDTITSADFIYSWQRALSPALGSQYTFLFTDVIGGDDYSAGKLDDFSQVGFAAPNLSTVVVTLKRPTPYFLSNMANNAIWYPVHRNTIESLGHMTDRNSGWTKPETFVGNGPFHITEWKPNDVIRARKSLNYWNADQIELNGLVFHAFDNIETEERAFRAGQLHRTSGVPIAKLPGYREQSPTPLREIDSLITRFLNLNTTRRPFDDQRVRRAFALAIDREALARHVYLDVATPARRVVPSGMPSYPTGEDFSDDETAAQVLLADAGYPDGVGFPTTELSTEAGAGARVTEALQAQWREVLGVNVEILNSESRVHWSKMQQGDFDIGFGGWVADYPDATSYLDLWKTGSGWNFTGWNDSEYDAALENAARQIDPPTRLQALREAEGILLQYMPIIPLVFAKNPMLVHPSVKDYTPNAMDRRHYHTVSLKTELTVK